MFEFLLVLIVWAGLAGLVAAAASSKGRSGVGFYLLAFFLSPLIGFLAVIAMSDRSGAIFDPTTMRKCPHCAEFVKRDATVCRFCGSSLPALPALGMVPLPLLPPQIPAKSWNLLIFLVIVWVGVGSALIYYFIDRADRARRAEAASSVPPSAMAPIQPQAPAPAVTQTVAPAPAKKKAAAKEPMDIRPR